MITFSERKILELAILQDYPETKITSQCFQTQLIIESWEIEFELLIGLDHYSICWC